MASGSADDEANSETNAQQDWLCFVGIECSRKNISGY